MEAAEKALTSKLEEEPPDGKHFKDEYRTSRVMYTLEAAFEYFISILVSGTYLAKLTTTIGISDSMTAVLSTITSLASSFQLISIFLSHKAKVKRMIIPATLAQFLNAVLYLIPFITIGESMMGMIFFVTILTVYIVKSIMLPLKTNWFMGLVEPKKRGSYTAVLQAVSLIGGMAFTVLMGVIIDKFDESGNIRGAFILLSVLIAALALFQLCTIIFSKEKPTAPTEKKASPLSDVGVLWHNKRYVRFVIVNAIWAMATNLSLPFFGTYQINELNFSMTLISVLSTVLSVVQLVSVAFFGRLSMLKPCLTILKIGYPIAVISYTVMAFTTPENGLVMFIVHRVLTLVGNSAITIGGTITYQITSYKERTAALALNSVISGAVGFASTLVATMLFDYIKIDLNSTLFGLRVYAQQFLSALTAIIGILLIAYIYTFFARAVKADGVSMED